MTTPKPYVVLVYVGESAPADLPVDVVGPFSGKAAEKYVESSLAPGYQGVVWPMGKPGAGWWFEVKP